MENKTRKPHLHAFEIKAFADGWEILYWSEANRMWRKIMYAPDVDTKKYVVNDALVDFRKAEKEGRQVQARYYNTGVGRWDGVKMQDFEPTIESRTIFRIKPKIDLSILNDEDVFYMIVKGKGILVSGVNLTTLKDEFDSIDVKYAYSITEKTKEYNTNILKDDIREIELAVSYKKKKIFYSNFPEFTEKPVFQHWDKLPSWINSYVTMDEDGVWMAYSSKPKRQDEYWSNSGASGIDYVNIPEELCPKFSGSWEDSLIKNPNLKENE